MKNNKKTPLPLVIPFCLLASVLSDLRAEVPFLEPGTLRLSHEVMLENILHRVTPGWRKENRGMDKIYSKDANASGPWNSEWGESLLTEVATQVTPDMAGRVLFEVQGDYADRLWRSNNINHHIDNMDRHVLLREAEASIERSNWYARGFSGVAHGNWRAQGDLFGLYPASNPSDDYLRASGYFGLYPDRFNQNLFHNISKDRAPQGAEAGAQFYGLDGAIAYGDDIQWGYAESFYGRLGTPVGAGKLTFAYRDEDVPYSFEQNSDERKRSYALSFAYPEEKGHWLDVGVMYQPFRVGRTYKVAREAENGTGLLGSSWNISEEKTEKADGLAGRLRVERHAYLGTRDYLWALDLTRAGVLAGNKEEADASLATDLIPILRGKFRFIYRRPIEGPIPFLYEGTPDNIGAIAANPRGPEAPFTVDWNNRETSMFITTFIFDPTPGTSLFIYDPDVLQAWNVNPEENASMAVAAQFKLTDYKTTTDRQMYYNNNGELIFEPAAHTGAWATDHPLPEFRVLVKGSYPFSWTLGVAGGQSAAPLGLAYSNSTAVNKPITDYYSVEGRVEKWPMAFWGHYGYGVWGPEPYQHAFGESFDRLWGLGTTYNFTVNTSLDVSYLAARQDDDMFVAPDLGTFDEIRTVFSHRFGFLFLLQDAARPGYKAR